MLLDKDKIKKIIVFGVITIGLGYGIGRYSTPAKVITKTEVKEVIKIVESKKENKNVKTTTTRSTSKDGSVIEQTVTEDRSSTETSTDISSSKEQKKESISIRDIGLSAQALAILDTKNSNKIEYGILIKKRIVGNVSGSILATEKGKIGVGIGVDF